MENSKIAWTHHTVNLWWGCYEVHAGCDNCYAKKLANVYHGPHLLWQQQGPRMMIKSAFRDILKYQAKADKLGIRYRVFMNSMSDLFEKSMPVVDFQHKPIFHEGTGFPVTTSDLRQHFFKLVIQCPNLIFLCLTKRPSNILKEIPLLWEEDCPENIMFGTSVVNQDTADTLIPQLLDVPGKRFLSMEPLIGGVDLCVPVRMWQYKKFGSFHTTYFGDKIHWVIVGGESGHNSRPMMLSWVKKILDQCNAAGTPFFMKQDSQALNKDFHNIGSMPEVFRVRQFPAYHDLAPLKYDLKTN